MGEQKPVNHIRKIPGWIKAGIGFVSAVITFILLILSNPYLGITVTVTVVLCSFLLLCAYIRWARLPPTIPGGKGWYRYEKYRRGALIGGIVILVVFVLLGFIEPTRSFVFTAFIGTVTPTSTFTPAPTFAPPPTPAPITVLEIQSETQPDGSTVFTSFLRGENIGTGKIQVISPQDLHVLQTGIVVAVIFPDSKLLTHLLPSSSPGGTNPSTVVANAPKHRTPAPEPTSVSSVITDFVKIYPVMAAELIGSGFEISPGGHQQRAVTSDTSVQWKWSIYSKLEGSHRLILNITIPVQVGQGIEEYNVYEQEIPIRVSPMPELMYYPDMLTSPVLIAILISLVGAVSAFIIRRRRT